MKSAQRNALIFYQILSTNSLWKYLCIKISLEILFVDIGALRVITGKYLYLLQGQQQVRYGCSYMRTHMN